MGCVQSKRYEGAPPPRVLYCRPPEGALSHMLEHVDLKKLSKLVRSERLAPLYPHDVSNQDAMEECPICTVSYPSMNTASCCAARVCTECFVYHQTASDPPGKAQCPFCNNTPFAVRYLGRKPLEQLQQEREDEQIWKHVKQRRRQQQNTPILDEHLAGMATVAAVEQIQQQGEQVISTQQQQQEHHTLGQHMLDPAGHQHSWLDDLLQAHAARRVAAINVFAGFHARFSSSSSSRDTVVQSDPLPQHTLALPATHDDRAPGGDTAGAAAAPGSAEASPQRGDDRFSAQQQRQQQQQLHLQEHQDHEERPEAGAEQLLGWQLAELQQLLDAGMLPMYAFTELSGLEPEELDEILLEQAVLTSLHEAEADDCPQEQQQLVP